MHGGGFWLGTVEFFDRRCRHLAATAACVVFSVDYRLAPEHPFPAALEDCDAALLWVVERADDLRVDSTRLSVGGESAGANLAAALALLARDRTGPSLVAQVLEVPVLDLTLSSPSVETLGSGYLLTKESMQEYVGYYTDAASRTHPYASPMFAESLAGLPPALITTAEFDPLRDEGEAYARRLEDAGVPVTYECLVGHIHGSFLWTKLCTSALAYQNRMASRLAAAYQTPRVDAS
jgi:acetyl esterase